MSTGTEDASRAFQQKKNRSQALVNVLFLPADQGNPQSSFKTVSVVPHKLMRSKIQDPRSKIQDPRSKIQIVLTQIQDKISVFNIQRESQIMR